MLGIISSSTTRQNDEVSQMRKVLMIAVKVLFLGYGEKDFGMDERIA